jgi:hypothetical protein
MTVTAKVPQTPLGPLLQSFFGDIVKSCVSGTGASLLN